LPIGASDRQIELTKCNALAPIRQRIEARRMADGLLTDGVKTLTESPQSEQGTIDQEAKNRLVEQGLAEVSRHAQRMLKRFTYDTNETATEIEQRVRAKVEEALREELDGSESSRDVIDLVRDTMEEIEGCAD
jgi:hypothetical protein